MRIAIVNDVPLAVEVLKRAVRRSGEHSLAWVAYDGQQAVDLCARDLPDLILMDLIMPVLDGVEATRRIMQASPCAILIVTGSVGTHSKKVFEALSAGALDAVTTPVLEAAGAGADGTGGPGASNWAGTSALLYKISSTLPAALGSTAATPGVAAPKPSPHDVSQGLVVLGASAGGPAALAQIMAGLPANFPAAVVVVQHLDAQFAPGLVSWLSGRSKIPVRLVTAGDRPIPGTALVAGTNDHLVLRSDGSLGYTPEPAKHSYRPSIDVFLESVERYWRGEVVGVLLTGMGRDGAQGLKKLRATGALTLTQTEADCVVYGMPKAAVEIDAATQILSLDQITQTLTSRFADRFAPAKLP